MVSREFKIAFCCDVMEHIHPDHVLETLSEITRVSKYSVFNISLRPAGRDSDGRDQIDKLHLSVNDAKWWLAKLAECGEILKTKKVGSMLYAILNNE